MQANEPLGTTPFELIQRKASVRRFDVTSLDFLARSFQDLRPRKIHSAKLAATLGLQTPRPDEFNSPWHLDVFCDDFTGLPQDLHRLIPESPRVRVYPVSCFEILDRIAEINVPTVLVVEGDYRAPRDMAQVSLANILDGIDRNFREHALRHLAEQAATLEKSQKKQAEIIVQERPGKFASLPGIETTLKAVQKKIATDLANFISRRDQREPAQVYAFDGWGASSLALSPSERKGSFFASATLRLRGQEFGLEMSRLIAKQTLSWTSLMTGSDEVGSVWLSVPHVSIAGQIMGIIRQLRGDAPVQFRLDDLLLGWNPAVTATQFLQSKVTKPAVFVVLDRFPSVELAVIWK